MAVEISVPDMGESVSTAFLSSLLVEEGGYVEEGADLCELESDKATLTVPSPASGAVHWSAELEAEVEVGSVIGSIDTDAARDAPAAEEQQESPPPAAEEHSPAVRRALAESGLDPSSIKGSGKEGRILKEDVERAAAEAEQAQAEKPAQKPAQNTAQKPAAKAEPGSREVRREKMSRIRQTIAANLVASKQESAHLTTFNEVDVSRIMAIRKSFGEDFLKDQGVKLGFMSFFVRAATQALQRFPAVNAALDGDEMLYHDYCDIGIAVSTERGLVVPVLRNAEGMSFAEIESAIKDFGQRARDRKLGVDEMSGGTFSITNGGIFGSLLSTPIPTPPQTAVLGMHTIQKRPVAVDDQVVIRPMMYVALTYDHRVIDGKEAVGFLSRMKQALENPERMLLEV